MAQNKLKDELLKKTFSYQLYRTRKVDLDKEHLKEYNRLKQRESRRRKKLRGK